MLTFIPLGVIAFLSPVHGILNKIPISQSESMNSLAELAVWESLGISDVDFNSNDEFLTSLGFGEPPDYENGMRFLLYNRKNRLNGIEITADPDNLKKLLNPNIATKIFIHGFRSNFDSEVSVIVRKAYLDRGDCNMIIVDWGPLAVAPNYIAARSHAVGVANRTAQLLDALADSKICAPKDQHVIGHSLGAHIAGLASGSAKTRAGRCTGLDPAGPLFQISTNSGRLDLTSADLVDVIHTAAAFLGFPGPLGHIDFYPNGGVWPQPGCRIDIDGDCSHVMAVKFFVYTINNPGAFKAFRCQTHGIIRGDCPPPKENATMGENIEFQTPGLYYLEAKLS